MGRVGTEPLGEPPGETLISAALELWEQAGEQHWLPVAGRSMRPLFQPGDSLLVVHGGRSARPGDVIVFRQAEWLVTHRLLRIKQTPAGTSLICKGDAMHRCDPPVSANNLVGRVVSVRRGERLAHMDTLGWRLAGRLIAGLSLAEAHIAQLLRRIIR